MPSLKSSSSLKLCWPQDRITVLVCSAFARWPPDQTSLPVLFPALFNELTFTVAYFAETLSLSIPGQSPVITFSSSCSASPIDRFTLSTVVTNQRQKRVPGKIPGHWTCAIDHHLATASKSSKIPFLKRQIFFNRRYFSRGVYFWKGGYGANAEPCWSSRRSTRPSPESFGHPAWTQGAT